MLFFTWWFYVFSSTFRAGVDYGFDSLRSLLFCGIATTKFVPTMSSFTCQHKAQLGLNHFLFCFWFENWTGIFLGLNYCVFEAKLRKLWSLAVSFSLPNSNEEPHAWGFLMFVGMQIIIGESGLWFSCCLCWRSRGSEAHSAPISGGVDCCSLLYIAK